MAFCWNWQIFLRLFFKLFLICLIINFLWLAFFCRVIGTCFVWCGRLFACCLAVAAKFYEAVVDFKQVGGQQFAATLYDRWCDLVV